MTKPIQAFLFDLGNVIVQFDHRLAASEIASHSKVGVEELYRLFFESELVVDHDRGRISTGQFYEGLRSQIGLSLSFENFLHVWNNIFTENEATTRLLHRLLPRYPCFLISNTNRPHFEFCRDRYPILKKLSGWVLSYEVGELKPHPKIYRRALELAQVPAEEIFYVDDREDLVDAGRKLGLQSHRFEGADHLQRELSLRGVFNGR